MGKISDEAVKTRTGKTKGQWYSILDKAGARKLAHKEIATLLCEKHKLDGWWAQMVSVEYEHARGRRQPLQKCDGEFAGGASRVMAVALPKLYRAWDDPKARAAWLKEKKLEVTTATKDKSMRIRWKDGTRVSVYFYAKGSGRSSVVVDHMKLADTKAAEKMKVYWASAMDRLQRRLEGGIASAGS